MGTDALQVRRNGDFYYPIYFEDGFEKLADAIRTEGLENRNFCIVTDTNVAPLYAAEVQKVLSPVASKISVFTFEAGEKSKNLNTVQQLYKVLIEEKLDRKSLIIALGGGVVGDLAGFGAATYLRGIDFIQVPTTLLSQVDSSVGGKTGVDLEQYKNMVGAFQDSAVPPWCARCSPRMLLPVRGILAITSIRRRDACVCRSEWSF